MQSIADFTLDGNGYADAQKQILRKLYRGDSLLHHAGARTLDVMEMIEKATPPAYQPANGARYAEEDEFAAHLKTVAQMIKMNAGLRAVTVDLGGWDTHEYQGEGTAGMMAELLKQFASGVRAFYTDLDGAGAQNFANRTTIVVMSEFGRRLQENASRGTDHGHGSVMLALGGNVNGGAVYGAWPGLRPEQLYQQQDLAVTTDYRQVLSEILIRRCGNPNLSQVFPGYTGYKPLGIVRGEEIGRASCRERVS
jgi:uncharacterized protein (DUF1501 family)